MSRILVTGGTGFLGDHLVRRLIEDGHQVLVLARNTAKASQQSDGTSLPAPTYVKGDILDVSSLRSAFRDCESVFHLAGLIAYKKSERQAMEKVNVTGTQNVVDVCQEMRIPQLLYMSSVVAVGAGRSPNEILNEDSVFNLSGMNLGYFETKRMAEAIVRRLSTAGTTRCVIVNPSTIYGPGDAKKSSRKTQVKVARGSFPFYTSGGVSVVDIEDVITGIILAWQKGRNGERYILSGENITIQKLFQLIAQAAGVKEPWIHLPTPLLHLLGIVGDFKSGLGMESSLSRENAWTATLYHWFDSSKARRELGFEIRPAKISIEKSVLWMRQNGLLN